MNKTHHTLLLADDDMDDCMLFEDALKELPVSASLFAVYDGVQWMNYLMTQLHDLPDLIFPDLNIPRKSGFECLSEIKLNEKSKKNYL